MKQVNNGFAEQYYIDRKGYVYNAKTDKWVQKDRKNYKIHDKNGALKSISQKKLYELVYNDPFCTDDIDLLEGEEFKVIPNTDNRYFCSNLGRIKSYERYKAKIMNPTETKKGYLRVQIKQEGRVINKFVHSLVASVWLGKPDDLDMEIHHIDLDKKNNRAENLQYLTRTQHAQKHLERKDQQNNGEQYDQDSTKSKSFNDKQTTD